VLPACPAYRQAGGRQGFTANRFALKQKKHEETQTKKETSHFQKKDCKKIQKT